MRMIVAFCMLVMVGLVLLPTPTFAIKCPPGVAWSCWQAFPGGELHCKCHMRKPGAEVTSPPKKPLYGIRH